MLVECYGEEFDVPDTLVAQFKKDLDVLPGSSNREGVLTLRGSIEEILDIVAEDPEILYEKEYLDDFVRALALRHVMKELGILYDS